MARIIAHGTTKKPPPGWPVGTKTICQWCGCQWEIEAGDDIDRFIQTVTINGRPSGQTPIADVRCPECYRIATLSYR